MNIYRKWYKICIKVVGYHSKLFQFLSLESSCWHVSFSDHEIGSCQARKSLILLGVKMWVQVRPYPLSYVNSTLMSLHTVGSHSRPLLYYLCFCFLFCQYVVSVHTSLESLLCGAAWLSCHEWFIIIAVASLNANEWWTLYPWANVRALFK